jgi:chromosome segregation ATPase
MVDKNRIEELETELELLQAELESNENEQVLLRDQARDLEGRIEDVEQELESLNAYGDDGGYPGNRKYVKELVDRYSKGDILG